MARPGPKAQPTHLRLLTGSHPERVNRDEPKPRAVLPECPHEVSAEVREIWDYLLGELAVMRSVTSADRDALVCLAEAINTHRKASALLSKSAILIRSARDPERQLVRNPVLAIQRDAAQTIRLYCNEFGMTPASRSGIRVGPGDGPADDLLGG